MKAETTRFGTIEVKEQSIIRMRDGVLGFPHCKRFVLLEDDPLSAFRWLQSVDDPSVAFIVIDPLAFFPAYEIELPDDQALGLGINDPKDAAVLTTVTIDRQAAKVTANLVGPIVMNARTLAAGQVVLSDDRYTTSHVIGRQEADESDAPELAKAA